jgi:hypothetical protein
MVDTGSVVDVLTFIAPKLVLKQRSNSAGGREGFMRGTVTYAAHCDLPFAIFRFALHPEREHFQLLSRIGAVLRVGVRDLAIIWMVFVHVSAGQAEHVATLSLGIEQSQIRLANVGNRNGHSAVLAN